MTTEASSRWTKCQLSEICQRIVDGSHNPPSAREIGEPMLSARNIEQGQINWNADFRLISPEEFEVEDARTQVTSGDVLLTIVGAIGRTAVVPSDSPKFTLQRSVAVLRQPHVSSEFLSYTIQSPEFQKRLHASAKGTAQKGVYLKTLGAMELGIAPINEQRRIVAKLDALFEKSRSIREKLDRLPRLLANLQKSILNSLLNNTDSKNWNDTSLIDLCEPERSLTYGIIKLGDHKEDGVPVLRSSNVRHLGLELDGMKKVSPSLSDEYSRTILQGNEVVVTVRGTLGGVAAVSHEHVGWNVSREVAVIPLKKDINPEFVALAIAAPNSQAWLRGTYKGVAYTGINIADLKLLRIRLPHRSKQDEIVLKFKAAQAAIQNLAAGVESGMERLEGLQASILSKAFRGELVPQDPNDEPASVLLERIRAQKPAAGTKRGRGRKATA